MTSEYPADPDADQPYPLPASPEWSAAAPPTDAGGAVALDLACRKCAYNLRGLPLTGQCPECGTPVGLSVHGDLLRYSDPAWLDTLGRGVTLILTGVAVIIAGVVLALVVSCAGGLSSTPERQSIIAQFANLVGGILILIGSWFLTAPDPSGLGEERYGTVRKVVRIGLLIGLAQTGVGLLIQAGGLPGDLLQAITVLSALLGIVQLVGYVAELRYLEQLARRIPDAHLAGRAHFLTYAIGISYGVLIVVGIGAFFLMGPGILTGRVAAPAASSGAMTGVGCVGGIAGVALLVFGVMYMFMIANFGRQFTMLGRLARQMWRSARAAPTANG